MAIARVRNRRNRSRLVALGVVVLAAGLAVVASPEAAGADLSSPQRLTASDPHLDDSFGWDVAISGETMVVGAPRHRHGAERGGAAYVFVRDGAGWVQQAELLADDRTQKNSFGNSVATSGDTIVIGDCGNDEVARNAGAAYVFVRSGNEWTQQAKLTAGDATPRDEFGCGVAVDGDTVLIAARLDDDLGDASGSVYVFARAGGTWTEQTKLNASDGAAGDFFGSSLALSGGTAVVGASGADAAYPFTGAGANWSEQAILVPTDPAVGFGRSVAIDDDTVLVAFDVGYTTAVFRQDGNLWRREASLMGGTSVSVSGDTALLGAGVVFGRTGTQWVEQSRADDPSVTNTQYSDFGFAVALDGLAGVVTAPGDDGEKENAGAAFVYDVRPHCQGLLVTILGTDSADTIVGTSGDDVIDGLAGPDVIDGAGGDDTICGGTGADELSGRTGNDSLSGGGGHDTLIGAAGDDRLDGGQGNDVLRGGPDVDTAAFANSSKKVDVDLRTGSAVGDGTDVLSGIENVEGTPKSDELRGDSEANRLSGGAGNDLLVGGDGDDDLEGQAGADVIWPGAGSNAVKGGYGVDTVVYDDATTPMIINLKLKSAEGAGIDELLGLENVVAGPFDDMIRGTKAINKIEGRAGDDVIMGSGGDDVIRGEEGNDDLRGDVGSDRLIGGTGSDHIRGGGGADTIIAGSGDDELYGDDGADTIDGQWGNDIILGGMGDDAIDGGNNNDAIAPGPGTDVVEGGPGVDLVSYFDATRRVVADLDAGTAVSGPTDAITGFEWLEGSRFDDVLRGTSLPNVFFGLDGADRIKGRDGMDTLVGGPGDDQLNGGSGPDTASYFDAATGVAVNLASGIATGEGTDILNSIEDIVGSPSSDQLTGDSNVNVIEGRTGGDTIRGSSSGDYLFGMGGNDSIYGDGGDDGLDGGPGTDALDGGTGSDVCLDGETHRSCESVGRRGGAETGGYRVPWATHSLRPALDGGIDTFESQGIVGSGLADVPRWFGLRGVDLDRCYVGGFQIPC